MSSNQDVVKLLQKTSRLLSSGHLKAEPVWYRALLATPPTTQLRHVVARDPVTGQRVRATPGRPRLFKPRPIVYAEDALRTRFFTEHPWELSRPRVVVENTGADAALLDWSQMQQKHKPLDGESVVQRTLWLTANEQLTTDAAYTKARYEFYRLRMRQEIEDRVAEEEAAMFGAVFFPRQLDVGIKLEDAQLASWREQALEATRLLDSVRPDDPDTTDAAAGPQDWK
ncbi:mitochondrial 37S ribosomal protein mS23 [Dipodascopsis tothii]|uniref:mitochondrial 37S ribosomal protein mS23 n=1 Tax=Dipodascopsis tothii TaxID=44089 RepID=UPI0034CECF9F